MNISLIRFKRFTTNLLIISVIVEVIFFFDLNNIIACGVLLYGWFIIKTFALTQANIKNYPVSFLMVFGLAIFHFVLPLPLTLLEFKPVTYNMVVPLLTFLHHFLFVTVIVITYNLYIYLSKKKNIFRSILNKTNFYKTPSDRIIWITAIIGLIASFYIYFIYGQWQKENSERTVLYYLATFFVPFVWMPIIIPFKKFRRITHKKISKVTTIVIYSILVLIIALATNMRTIMFSGVMILIFLIIIGILFGYYEFKKYLSTKKLIVIIILFFLVSGPLTDFGVAMVIVRHERTQLSAADFLSKTISVAQDKETLNKIKSVGIAVDVDQPFLIKGWNEDYLNNFLLNRFCNLKISDNCIYHAKNLGYANPAMQIYLARKILAGMPNILINFFGMNYSEKAELESYSITDYLYSLSIDDPSVRGSAIVGSMPGIGMAVFGYWYLIVIIPVFIIIFSMFDSFVKIVNGEIVYSYFYFIMLLMMVNYFNDKHVYSFEFRYILRDYTESIVIFLIIMKALRFVESLVYKTKS